MSWSASKIVTRSYRPARPASAALRSWKVTRSSTPLPSRFVRAASIEARSESMPSTSAFGYARAISMLDRPWPQATSATRAGSEELSRSWISGTAGSHSLPSWFSNSGRVNAAWDSCRSSP